LRTIRYSKRKENGFQAEKPKMPILNGGWFKSKDMHLFAVALVCIGSLGSWEKEI
jgi:hypothetical protein